MTETSFIDALYREIDKRKTAYPKILERMAKKGASDDECLAQKGQFVYQTAALNMLYRYLTTQEPRPHLSELEQIIVQTELDRELKMRRRHYPRFIYFKRIDPETAQREIELWAKMAQWFKDTHS